MYSKLVELLKQKKIFDDKEIQNKNEEEIDKMKNQFFLDICYKSMEIFMEEPNIVQYDGNAFICGDLHGNYDILLYLFNKLGYPPKSKYIFLGDLVDRGKESLYIVLLLFALKIDYPEHIFIIRGNHETPQINSKYGFYDECVSFFKKAAKVYTTINKTFSYLPLGCLINNEILCIHGGISEKIQTLYDICGIDRFQFRINDEVLTDLLWSDPLKDFPFNPKKEKFDALPYYQLNSTRKCGADFTGQSVSIFCKKNGLKCIIRGHQQAKEGCRIDYNGLLYTINTYNDNGETPFCVIEIKDNVPNVLKLIEHIQDLKPK